MLRSDARTGYSSHCGDSSFGNIDSINLEAISQIEQELDSYDVNSMVFLLYDVADTALSRLLVYQRCKDIGEQSLNLLRDWAQYAQARPTWKYEFLEALAICQLYRVIRRLGLSVSHVKKHFLPDNIQVNLYINPFKKCLYKLCENMSSDNIKMFRNTVNTYDYETKEYECCELIILELICRKFIKIDVDDSNIEPLARIVDNLSGLKSFSNDLRDIAGRNDEPLKPKDMHKGPSTSTPALSEESSVQTKTYNLEKNTIEAFRDEFKMFAELNLEETINKNLKSDKTRKIKSLDAYPIKNPKRIGVCYIINIEEFHPSRENIEKGIATSNLEKRMGSTKDKKILQRTMEALNFEVIAHDNLDNKKMITKLKEMIEYRVHPDDSMFMLCILSHGVSGHVFAADSVKVKIDDIQNLLDSGFQKRQMTELPKIMILQACQVNEEIHDTLVADAPYFKRKSDFLIFYATAPELEAFRDEMMGSLFIQILCYMIEEFKDQEPLHDIFTYVIKSVRKICTKLRKEQTPEFRTSLTRKLYLQMPQ